MTGDKMELVWKVPYKPGKLKGIASSNGNPIIADSVQTASQPTRIKVVPNETKVPAGNRHVIRLLVKIADKKGVVVPDADNKVFVKISGPGQLIGVENGDILDLSPNKVNWRKAFMGKCIGLVQTTGSPGEIVVTVSAKGLKSDTVHLKIL